MSPRDRSYSDGSDPGVTTVCQFVHRCYPSARCGAATDSRPDGSVRSRWVRPRRNEFVSVVPQAAGRAPNSAAFGSVVDACDQVRPPQDAHCRARQPHFVAGVGREEDLVARLDPYAFRPDGGDDAGAAVGLRRGRNDQAQVRLRLLVRGLDHDEVVERLEREVDPAGVVLLHLHEESYIRPAAMMRSRNCRVRGSVGSLRIRSGGPCSRMTPSSRKQTRSAMSRAKLISCVAITIVIPPAASSRITSSTSATSSGSSALVTSSSSIRSGRIASARTIATRCCWPPESESGKSLRLSARPKRARSAIASDSASARDLRNASVGASVTLRRTLMCGKRLYAWKTMPIRRRIRLTSTLRAVIS